MALQRGPVVYCLEGVDNGGQVRNLVLPKDAKLTAEFDKDLLGGVVVVKGEAQAVTGLDDDDKPIVKPTSFVAVPVLHLGQPQAGADGRSGCRSGRSWPSRPATTASCPTASASRRRTSGRTTRSPPLNDGAAPKSSNDQSIRRHDVVGPPRHGGMDAYRFAKPRKIDGCSVYWFDDTGVGQCRVPAEWRLLWRDGDEWKPVKLTGDSAYGTALDQFNKVTFEPVTTRELKMEVKLKKDFSGGVLKWTVSEAK